MAYDLAIVLPTFNESGNVGPIVNRLEQALKGIRYEVIFVDDDSPDGTADVVRRLARDRDNLRVLQRIGRRGLASACIEGILAAAAPYVAVMDADLQHDESILPEMLRRIREENLDLVVGSRNIAGGSMGEFARWRVKLSQLGRRFSLMGAEHELSDPMSGFFLVRLSTFERFAHRLSGIGFKILLDIVLSAGPGLRIGEVPYRFRLREHGESKLDVLVGLEYFELLVDKHLGGVVNVRFVLFGMVGAVGVGVHLLILRTLLQVGGLKFRHGPGSDHVHRHDPELRAEQFRDLPRPAAAGMEIHGRVDHVLPGLRTGRSGERGHCERGVPPRRAVGTGGGDGTDVHCGVELRRDLDDHVAAGAALERAARPAADRGGKRKRRGRDAGEDDVKDREQGSGN